MAPRIGTRSTAPKRPADLSRGCFYPGEVVRILGLHGVDYRQLRQLFRIAKKQSADGAAPVGRQWARFSFQDLVAVKTAFHLAGGVEALQRGRRLRLTDVELICDRLRRDFGLSNPLTEIVFRRSGKTILAKVQGLWFEPATGQMALAEVQEAIGRYLDESAGGTRGRRNELRRRLKKEARELKRMISASGGLERSRDVLEVGIS
jgi:hypothetical protein